MKIKTLITVCLLGVAGIGFQGFVFAAMAPKTSPAPLFKIHKPTASPAKTHNIGKPTVKPQHIRMLPDLVVEKIWLNRGYIAFKLRNTGKGAIPDGEYQKGRVAVTCGGKTQAYAFTRHLNGNPPVDAKGTLKKPGESLSFTTGIKPAAGLKTSLVSITVFADNTRQVHEQNEQNNTKTVRLSVPHMKVTAKTGGKTALKPATQHAAPMHMVSSMPRVSIEKIYLHHGTLHVRLRNGGKTTLTRAQLRSVKLHLSTGAKARTWYLTGIYYGRHLLRPGGYFDFDTGLRVAARTNVHARLEGVRGHSLRTARLAPALQAGGKTRAPVTKGKPATRDLKMSRVGSLQRAPGTGPGGSIKALIPDLIISRVTSSYQRSKFVLECEIKNINWKNSKISMGKDKGLLCLYLHAPEHYGSNRLEFLTDAQINTLNAFGSVVMKIDWPYSGETYLKIDAWQKVFESDEINNEYTYTCNYCLPNFRITKMYYKWEDETVALEFINDSNCNYDGMNGILITYQFNPHTMVNPAPLHKYWIRGIFKAGETRTVILTGLKWPKPEARLNCAAIIDTDNSIKETNEDDNLYYGWLYNKNLNIGLLPKHLEVTGGAVTSRLYQGSLLKLSPSVIENITGGNIKLNINFRLINYHDVNVDQMVLLKIGNHTFYVHISLEVGEAKWFHKEVVIFPSTNYLKVTLFDPIGYGKELCQGWISCSKELVEWVTNPPYLYIGTFKVETKYPALYHKVKLLCKIENANGYRGVGKHMTWKLTINIYKPFDYDMPIHSKTWVITGKPGKGGYFKKRFEFIPKEHGKYKFECRISSKYPIILGSQNKEKNLVFKHRF